MYVNIIYIISAILITSLSSYNIKGNNFIIIECQKHKAAFYKPTIIAIELYSITFPHAQRNAYNLIIALLYCTNFLFVLTYGSLGTFRSNFRTF